LRSRKTGTAQHKFWFPRKCDALALSITAKMRILQIVHGFPPQDYAGAELVTLYLAQALQDRGHQVTILAGSKDPEAEEHSAREENLQGLPIVRIVNNYTKTTTFRLSYENSFFDESFLRLLDRFQPELLLISAGFDAHHHPDY